MVRPLDPGPPIAPDLDEALEAAVLGAGRRYTRGEVADAAGLQIEEGTRLWRSLHFPPRLRAHPSMISPLSTSLSQRRCLRKSTTSPALLSGVPK